MRIIVMLLIGSVLILGCGEKNDGEDMPERYLQQETSSVPVPVTESDSETNIGDVESQVHIAAIVPEEAQSDTVQVEIIMTKKKRTAMTTVNLYPPYPETLPITFVLNSDQSFIENPVVLRAKVIREKESIGNFSGVITVKNGRRDDPALRSHGFDAFAGLDSFPETMSIHAQAAVLLAEVGTDAASIDPATYNVDDLMRKTVMLSNPIRINFLTGNPQAAPQE